MTPRRAWYIAALLLYLGLAIYQLGLPGLHYDEAKEAGLNAMEILTGAPIGAFRRAGIQLGGRTWPLMVQDYIGALNVYLALPLLALTGIGVPNLRLLPILTGLVALVMVERAVSEWVRRPTFAHPGRRREPSAAMGAGQAPIAVAGLVALTLLAASPSYVFWARQGVFVTNLMLPFVVLCLWQGVAWLRRGRRRALWGAAAAGGLALYAKLLAVWVVGPFALLAGCWWLSRRLRQRDDVPALDLSAAAGAVLFFCLPLVPLALFNLQTGGTLISVGGNLQQSYYGVDNADIVGNLPVRLAQLRQVLTGEQFWYLGGSFANLAAPWLAVLAILVGLWRNGRPLLPPLLLLIAAFGASLFTLSDLFITHYVLLHPLAVATVAVGVFGETGDGRREIRDWRPEIGDWRLEIGDRRLEIGDRRLEIGDRRLEIGDRKFMSQSPVSRLPSLISLFLLLWLLLDVGATVRYHQALATSGGLADHSDASYHLAYHLRYNGMGAPVALDWGMDAPVRYLTVGTVTPIEIFGYASPAAPDASFAARLAPFLDNPDNRYLLHAPGATVFAGRREAFLAHVAARGAEATLEAGFGQRDGTPIYEIWRVAPAD